MSVLDELRFTELNFDLSDFVDRFRSEFPVILITRTGIDTSDDPLHCISAEEVYWINGIKRQKRIVAADINDDEHRRYFSIPLDYHRKFQVVCKEGRREILGHPVSMQKIVDEMNFTAGPTKFVFANRSNIRVNVEGSKSRCQKIETLKIVDRYEQKYLVGHTLYQNVMDLTPRSIPIYLDIVVDVATDFNGRTHATFTEWMKLVAELGRNDTSTPVKTCREIIQFGELPECGVYDYIQPSSYLKTQDVTDVTKEQEAEATPAQNIYGQVRRSRSSVETKRESHDDTSKPEPAYGTILLPPIPIDIPDSKSDAGKPPRPVPSPVMSAKQGLEQCRPALVAAFGDGLGENSSYQIAPYAESGPRSLSVFQRSLIRRKRQTAAIPQAGTNQYSECRPTSGTNQTSDDGLYETYRYAGVYQIAPYSESKPIFPEPLLKGNNNEAYAIAASVTSEKLADIDDEATSPDIRVSPENFEDIYETVHTFVTSKKPAECRLQSEKELPTYIVSGRATEIVKYSEDGNTDRSFPPPTQNPFHQFKQLSEVPSDIDLSSLSVSELAHCLHLLGLSKYSDVFRENDIDGKLVTEFTNQTLVSCFNFSDFEAMKFTNFLKGWRPNVT